MNLPKKYLWKELPMLASNRDGWKKHVQTLRNGSGNSVDGKPADSVHIMRTHSMARKQTASNPITMTATRTSTTTRTETQKYRSRDAHAALFRPKLKAAQPKQRRAKKQKQKELTDKQRIAEARSHYIIHHGTVQDAEQFLGSKTNNNNIAADTNTTDANDQQPIRTSHC